MARSRPGPSTRPASPTSTPPTAPGSSARTAWRRSVSISAPVDDAARRRRLQPLMVAPGSPMTFSGSAVDDKALTSIEISLRNTTTRENLASDGTWGTDAIAGWYRVSPVNLSGSNSTLDLHDAVQPQGGHLLVRRAGDRRPGSDDVVDQPGQAHVNAQVPGDAPPDGKLNVTGTVTGGQSLHLDLAGTATDDLGVKRGAACPCTTATPAKYLQPNGTLGVGLRDPHRHAGHAQRDRRRRSRSRSTCPRAATGTSRPTPSTPSTSRTPSTSGATARYRIYPGDLPPTLTDALLVADRGHHLHRRPHLRQRARRGRPGDAERRRSAIMNAANQYMSSSGAFTSTTPSWRTAFLTSPGTPGSNFSYTTPVVPDGCLHGDHPGDRPARPGDHSRRPCATSP